MTKRCTLPPAPDVADWLACRGLEEELYATALTLPRGHAEALEYLQAARRFFAMLVASAEPPIDAAARRRARRRLDDAAAGAHLSPAKHLQIVTFLALGGTVDDLPERAEEDAADAARSARSRLAARNLDEAEQARLEGDLARATSCYETAGELEAQAFVEMAADRIDERALAAASAAVCFFKAGTPARGLHLLEQVLAGELAPDDRTHLQELLEVLVVSDAPRVDAAHAAVNPTAPHRLTSPGLNLDHTERHLVTLAVERLPSFEAAAAELGVSPNKVQQLVKKYGLTTTWPPPARRRR